MNTIHRLHCTNALNSKWNKKQNGVLFKDAVFILQKSTWELPAFYKYSPPDVAEVLR